MRKSGMKNSVLCLVALLLGALLVGALLVPTPSASAAGAVCPSGGTPPPGATVLGGLEVNGRCILNGVTILGGVVVDSGAGLELENSTVSNGIVVNAGGELDIGHALNSSGGGTGNPNTIDGGIVLISPFDVDIFNATVYGGVTFTGTTAAFPFICGSDIEGDLNVSNATFPGLLQIGDPEGESGLSCPGSTISGSVLLSNVSGLVSLEGNQVNGSVLLLNSSRVEFGGNTIAGSAVCSGTTILPPPSPDLFGNIVMGTINTCPN
jgi:hypothetical protein